MPDPKNVSLPEIGTPAPDFTLSNAEGQPVRLKQFRGKHVVLYFYPKDDTPGCTTEAKEFQAHLAAFERAGAVIAGVSPDPPESHCKFRDKYGLGFVLLSDPEQQAAQAYGVWVEKNMYGRKYMGVQRATFLIDPEGKIAAVWPKVKPQGHAEQVLEAIVGG